MSSPQPAHMPEGVHSVAMLVQASRAAPAEATLATLKTSLCQMTRGVTRNTSSALPAAVRVALQCVQRAFSVVRRARAVDALDNDVCIIVCICGGHRVAGTQSDPHRKCCPCSRALALARPGDACTDRQLYTFAQVLMAVRAGGTASKETLFPSPGTWSPSCLVMRTRRRPSVVVPQRRTGWTP